MPYFVRFSGSVFQKQATPTVCLFVHLFVTLLQMSLHKMFGFGLTKSFGPPGFGPPGFGLTESFGPPGTNKLRHT